jgi:hypothetical protein
VLHLDFQFQHFRPRKISFLALALSFHVIKQQNKEWLEEYYYPMINSIEGQVKMIKRNPKVVEELENKGILKVNPADINDILKLDEWS